MLAVTNSGALIGVQAEAITIEVNSGERGELRYILVGLPDSASFQDTHLLEAIQYRNLDRSIF